MHSYTTKIDEDPGLTREEGRRKIAHVEWMLYGHQGSVSNVALEFHAFVWIIALKHFREFSSVHRLGLRPWHLSLNRGHLCPTQRTLRPFIMMVKWSVSVNDTESPKSQMTEGQNRDFLIFICITRTPWYASWTANPASWVGRVKHRARDSPHPL